MPYADAPLVQAAPNVDVTAGSFGTFVDHGGDRTETPRPPAPYGIIRNIAICVSAQLGLTIAFPQQSWSMALGMIGLALVCAVTTWQLGSRHPHPDRFATNTVSAMFVIWAMLWAAVIYEVHWRNGDQSLISVLGLTRQIILILFLTPRGPRYGERWPILLDLILGIVLCVVLTTTLWQPGSPGPSMIPETVQFCVGHGIYAALAIGSYAVQRRSPPMFLRPLAITQCIYSATSMLSLYFSQHWGWADNSPLWVYGDVGMIAYPLIAYYSVQNRRPPVVPIAAGLAPNQAMPLLIALLLLCLALGSAENQQIVAALIGIAGLFVFAFRVAFVTRQYRRAQEAVVTAGRMRVEALIDVVHELRSPLASVVLNASALARAVDIPPRLKPRVDTIANRCTTVTQLLNDVLDLERIEAGLMDISDVAVDVAGVCGGAVKAVATTADAAGVILRGPGDHGSPISARGDAGLLRRVIVNLLDNAIRFTPAGGTVTVSITHRDLSWIAVVVEDTGIGLSPDARATLFKRFGHAATPVNGAKGSGLGLSISSSAIEAMGGRLSLVARDDGPGTRATILLNRE